MLGSFVRVASAFALLSLLLPAVAQGQTQQRAVDPIPWTHRFWDQTNVTLTMLEAGAMTFDGATTRYALRKYPDAREGNPLARPFVDAGWPGQIVGGALVISSEVGLRYWLHKKRRHRLERILPMILATAHAAFGIRNYRNVRRLDRAR